MALLTTDWLSHEIAATKEEMNLLQPWIDYKTGAHKVIDQNKMQELSRLLRAAADAIDNLAKYAAEHEIPVLPNPALDELIKDSNLSVRARQRCRQHDIKTIGELSQLSRYDVLAWKNCGEFTANELEAYLKQFGLSFSDEQGTGR